MKRLLLTIIFFTCLISSQESMAQSGNCLNLDGLNDYVLVPNASQYLTGTDGTSMAGWFCIDDLIYGQGYLSLRDQSYLGYVAQDDMYMVLVGGGSLECRYRNNGGPNSEILTAPGLIQTGQWQHIAFVFTWFKFNVVHKW